MQPTRRNMLLVLSLTVLAVTSCLAGASTQRGSHLVNAGGAIVVEFDDSLRSRVLSGGVHGRALGPFSPSETIVLRGGRTPGFRFTGQTEGEWKDTLGEGRKFEITGVSRELSKTITIIRYDAFPAMLFFTVTYRSLGRDTLFVEQWTNNSYRMSATVANDSGVCFWSYQPGSYGWNNNWILPLKPGDARDNYLGMNSGEYGGGTPVADIWRPDCGIAVGHVAMVPKLVSLPVRMIGAREASFGITLARAVAVPPGGTLTTLRTFAAVHTGDYFAALTLYRQFMERQGFTIPQAPDDAHQNEWCSWGYEEHYTMEQLYRTLPKAKEVGLRWVVLDMGWYNAIGDFALNPARFPNGERDLKQFIDSVHAMGMKVQLWWMPFASMLKGELLSHHPEYLLLMKDGSPQFMPMFFKTFFLCPASEGVREYTRQQVLRLMRYGVDGLKIDGDNQNCVPCCYNPEHHHAFPEESVEAIPAFFRLVYETARSVNPQAKIEICPCGTNQSFYLMPYMNETVAADPHNSVQLRLKGKTLKALTGGRSVFYGDHVELSDGKSDFASTIGVGGVVGTKFVYPPGVYMNTESGDVSLTPEKEAVWKKWIGIANTLQLSRGTYRGDLYDLGFDRPEAHAIQKGETMYYAFYGRAHRGLVTLRGLAARSYRVVDYEHDTVLGVVQGPVGSLPVEFNNHLLLKVEPR